MAKIQVQGIGVYDDKILKKKIIDMANSLSKLAKKGEWSKSSENGIRALGRMWGAYQDWSRKNESVNESTSAYKKSLEKIAKDKQLKMLSKKDKETLIKIAKMMKEGPQRDMNNMALYIIDLNKELSNAKALAKKHPKYKKYIKFIQQDIKDAEKKLKKLKKVKPIKLKSKSGMGTISHFGMPDKS